MVSVESAQSCEACVCAPLRETCLLGPDSAGNFATSEVDPEFAANCPRETCTCSSHSDYQQASRYRIQHAIKVFEIKIGKQFNLGIDPAKIIDGDSAEPSKQTTEPASSSSDTTSAIESQLS